MLMEVLILLLVIFLLIFKQIAISIIILSMFLVFNILRNFRKENKPENYRKYFITASALSNKILLQLLNANIFEGEFHILSKEHLNKNDPITLKNLKFLKSKRMVIYVNLENRISEILTYSFKNKLILIISNENIPKHLLKMFNIKIIDLSFFESNEKPFESKDTRFKVTVASKTEDGYYCNRKDVKDVAIFLKNGEFPLEIGEEIDVIVENVFETPTKRIVYVKRVH